MIIFRIKNINILVSRELSAVFTPSLGDSIKFKSSYECLLQIFGSFKFIWIRYSSRDKRSWSLHILLNFKSTFTCKNKQLSSRADIYIKDLLSVIRLYWARVFFLFLCTLFLIKLKTFPRIADHIICNVPIFDSAVFYLLSSFFFYLIQTFPYLLYKKGVSPLTIHSFCVDKPFTINKLNPKGDFRGRKKREILLN